ncbi:uncharacterized protein LOC134268423 [Saccostrea cucullata]|uniref:uncharacterized protein LOC134268423 n=1 Tax=Saccostrea cuccullata TaxID=36930 RepID=UPI002ED2E5EC
MMEKRHSGFLIALMLITCKLIYCHAFLESPVKKKYVPNTRFKEEILKLAKDSVTEGILKVSKELKKNLEDLRLDMMRRDVELYEEIYNIKENLTGNDTAKEKQTTSLDDGERKVWLKKFEYLEAGVKKASQESKNNADTLQENFERLDRENKRILYRMDTTEITLMKVASQSLVNLNDSEGLIFTNYLRKLHRVDDRLNDINDTMQDVCNSTTEMQKVIGTFQSEVMALESSVDALNIRFNSTLDDKTRAIEDLADFSENIQLNLTKVLNENAQYFSKELLKLTRNVSEVNKQTNLNSKSLQDLSSEEKKLAFQIKQLFQDKGDLENKLNVLKNHFNITVTNFEDMKDNQKEISNDLMNSVFQISALSAALNTTNEGLGSLNNSFSEKWTDFKEQAQLFCKESLNQTEQLNNITATVDDLQIKVHTIGNTEELRLTFQNLQDVLLSLKNVTVDQQALSGTQQNLISSLMKNVSDHEQRLTNMSAELNSNTISIISIQGDITTLINVNRDQNRSISERNLERTQRPTEQLRVRLVGGSSASEGRVEVYYNNTWGTICDDNWESSDARVVCRMLGYTRTYTGFEQARYGQGLGPIWLDEVGCSGSESTIFSCSHGGWGVHDCSHGEDASVVCKINTMDKINVYQIIFLNNILSTLVTCQVIYTLPLQNRNVIDSTIDKQINTARDFMVEGLSNFGNDVNRKLDDLRIDMKHRDMEISEEINKLKQLLMPHGFAQDAQSRNGDNIHQSDDELSSRLASLEAGIKRVSKESKSEVRDLRRKNKILENENRMLSSRLDATQAILMLMSEKKFLNINESDDFDNLNLVQKINTMEDKLNYLNDSIQEKSNSNDEADELNILKNELQSVKLNLSEVKNDFDQSKTFSEIQSRQIAEVRECQTIFQDTLNILEKNTSIIWTYTSNLSRELQELGDTKANVSIIEGITLVIGEKFQRLQDDFSVLTVVSNNLSFQVNSTEEQIKDLLRVSGANNISQIILERNLKEEIDVLRKNISSIVMSSQLESNERTNLRHINEQRFSNITYVMENIQTQMNSTVQQLTILEAEKERVSILIENVTDHKSSLQDVVNGMQSNSRTISDIQSNITALTKITEVLNRSLSQQMSEETQQKRNTLILGVKLQNLQDDLSALTVVSNNLMSQFNSTEDRIEDLQRISKEKNNSDIIQKRNLAEKIESIQQNVSSLAISVQLESNERKDLLKIQKQRYLNITNVIESIQFQMNSTVHQQMALEADKDHLLLLKKNITDHEQRIGNIVTIAQSNSDTLSRIQSNITALMETTGALNRSFSRLITERNQQQLLVRLVGGRAAGEGRVEVYHSNAWGTICDDNWSSSDARVVCRMLGYSGSYTAYSSAHFGQGVGQIWLDEVGCSGSESTIFSCRSSGWGVHDCSHGEDASVKCT